MTNLIDNISSVVRNMRSTMKQAQAALDKLHALSAELDIVVDELAAKRDRYETDLTVSVEDFEEADAQLNAALDNLRNIEKEQRIFQDYIDGTQHILWRYETLWGLE